MAHKIHDYRGRDIIVQYDGQRCIHAAECVTRLRAVFDTSRRRWIEPDNAPADDIAEVVWHCPTGALHFERTDGGAQEPMPQMNTITLVANGPLYARGNVQVVMANGSVLLTDTRVALCRCGASKDKPFCDNTHLRTPFHAPGARREHEPELPSPAGAPATPLVIHVEPNGPYIVQGEVEIYGANDQLVSRENEVWLCRCGGSNDKPFCDSSHLQIRFDE